jgi:N-acetylmuramoyl-L-alanine amidase
LDAPVHHTKTAKILKNILEKEGAVILMSREKDTYLSFKNQAIFANKQKPHIIISLHTNNAEDQDVSGIEIWGYKDCDDILGDEIYRRFKQSKDFSTRLPRNTQWAVVKKTQYPAALIEMGFYKDMKKMIQPVFQTKFSVELKEALEEYFRKGITGNCKVVRNKKVSQKKPQLRNPQVYDNRKTDLSRIARR